MRSSVVVAVSQLDLARLQFAATSIYHFLFVPVTIGLAFLVAILQTVWHRRGDDEYLRLTRFFGTLLLINVAVGVVTGLVQEFQFGMAWSSYSRFVGDVFGAPLAIEGLAAFFLESTFLGLWLFGWGRLPKAVHLATIWLVALGTVLSAAFIMAANSWMQHPVGYAIDPQSGRAQLTSIWAVLTNPLFLWAYAHVLLAALVTGAGLMLAVSAWHLLRQFRPARLSQDREGRAASCSCRRPSSPCSSAASSASRATTYQPMKIAAGEALWNTEQPASFTLFQIGGYTADRPDAVVRHQGPPPAVRASPPTPGTARCVGMNQINAQYQQKYGPGRLPAQLFVAFWSIRVMAYLAGLVFLLALWGVWLLRRQKIETLEVVPAPGHLGRGHPLHHEHGRLGAHRERPPALDRAGPAAHPQRRVAVGQRDDDRHQPRRVRPALRRHGRDRRRAHDQVTRAGRSPRRRRSTSTTFPSPR